MIEPHWDVIRVIPERFLNAENFPAECDPGRSELIQFVVMEKVWWAQLIPSTLMGVETAHHYAVPGFRCQTCGVIVFASQLGQLRHDCDEIRDYKAAAFNESMRAAAETAPLVKPRRRTQEDLWR